MIFNIGMLTISNIAVRFLGMVYKVWLSQAISPVALGIFQLSMSVYMVLITPVASGLPNAVSRLSAKYMKQGHAGAVPENRCGGNRFQRCGYAGRLRISCLGLSA